MGFRVAVAQMSNPRTWEAHTIASCTLSLAQSRDVEFPVHDRRHAFSHTLLVRIAILRNRECVLNDTMPHHLLIRICSTDICFVGENAVQATPILLSENALSHLRKLKAEKGNDSLLLRVGVRSGGCSGLSYAMDFEDESKVGADDSGMQRISPTRTHTCAA
jgi:hypothetical protein